MSEQVNTCMNYARTPPSDFILECDNGQASKHDSYRATLQDIQNSMTNIESNSEKIDLQTFTTNINDKVVGVEGSMSRLENKFLELEKSLENKYDIWKSEALCQISSDSMDNGSRNEFNVIKAEHEFVLKQNKSLENHISLLHGELNEQNKSIDKLEIRTKTLSNELANKDDIILNHIEDIEMEKLHQSNYEKETGR